MDLYDLAKAEETLRSMFASDAPIEHCIAWAMKYAEALLCEIQVDAQIPGRIEMQGITFTLLPEDHNPSGGGLFPITVAPWDLAENDLAAILAERLTSAHILQEAE